MEHSEEMSTLSEVLERLRQKGLDYEVKMSDQSKMQAAGLKKTYQPDDLKIIKTYRFEGMSDPGDNAVLYLVEDQDKDIGYILDAYGIYSNNEGADFADFLKKIPVANRDEQELFS